MNEGKGQSVRDWSGNGNHGFLGSTPAADANDPAWVKGIFFGSALNFGGDDYVSIPDGASLEQQKLTVSLWFRASGSPGTFKYLIAKGAQDCTAASYSLQTLWHGGLQFVLWNGSQQFFSGAAGTEVWDGKWHHAAGTFDGTTPKLFIDGKLVPGGSVGSDQIDYHGPGWRRHDRRLPRDLRPALRRRHRRGARLVEAAAGRHHLGPAQVAAGHSRPRVA